MNQVKFFIDNSEDVSTKDLINIRTFYSPIVGTQGISLYHYFFDLYNTNNIEKYDLSETSEFLILSIEEIEKAKQKLEGIGLIRTFQDENGNLLIKLNKPLNANEIVKNSLISNLLISKIGNYKYQQLIKNNAVYSQDFSNLNDVSKNFFDVYSEENLILEQSDDNIFDFTLVDEAHLLSNLKSEEYIHYFTKKELSPSQILMLKKIKLLKFKDKAINAFIKYSINVNNSIVCNYIEKIANDFAKRNLFEAALIDSELNEIANFKNKNGLTNKINKVKNNTLNKYDDGLKWDD
ncbi:hypothetical protein DMC14_000590 [Metamycoplasma phocicerebrale]|uniref:Uncharacterized protein n=1 Tax=Metamycoplasma phocicerebrale TaxID=142649 RepID=A0A3Q9V9Y5_9BACT|nr:DnaD domain protein [Metamycoplasma phocicerebrale]AZZ65301.1 hypothetical protein DMC14_000590 [Metamycoplasma phocicerebrale]